MRTNDMLHNRIYDEGFITIDDVLEAMDNDVSISDFAANHIDGFQVETIFNFTDGV